MSQQEDGVLPSSNQPAKLTDWPKEPLPQLLRQDFDSAKQAHDTQVIKINHWNDLMQVKGKSKPKKVEGRSSVQPKLIRRQAEWRYSALTEPFLGSNKVFALTPVTFEDKAACNQNELLLNWQYRTKMNKVKFVDSYVRSTVDEGTCVVQIGWKRETRKVKKTVPVYAFYAIDPMDAASMQALSDALNLAQSDPTTYLNTVPVEIQEAVDYYNETGTPTTATQTGSNIVEVEEVVNNCPTWDILNPNNFYVDPSCNGDFDKAMFAVVSFETSRADLAKYPERYKNLDKVNWEANTHVTDTDHVSQTPTDFNFTDRLRKRVVAYEYWGFHDIQGDGTLRPIVATWIGDVMIRMEENPFPDGKLPFVIVPYMPVKRELFGEPDAELLEDNQAILGALTRGMIDSMGRSANAQQGIAKGMLDPLNRRRYDRGEDYEFNPGVAGPNQGIIEHKYPELPQSALLMLNLQNQEAESLTGVKAFSGGVSGDAYGDVAAGIRGALDAASKREMAILRRLAQGMKEIAMKIIAMNAVFLEKAEVVRVTNDEFVPVRREDLMGNFDLEVDISTAEIDNQKAQDLAFMLQTIGPNSGMDMVRMILAEIVKLKRMPDLAQQILNFKPEPNPVEEQRQQLELAKLQAEVDEITARAEKARADARKALADADRADLEFVEQETGTKHARDLEKQAAQARGNQDLQVTKALTSARKEGEKEPDLAAAIGFNLISGNRDNAGQAL
ncbi:PspA/IM30 family protein [Aurantimicrobium sp.]|uniref:PspA/IM30 family protein n=1 Tax=Aurantimicrobium sp. TaxID=1930784 RepID=UPI002FC68DE0